MALVAIKLINAVFFISSAIHVIDSSEIRWKEIRPKRNVDDAARFPPDEEEFCSLKDSCVVDNVTSSTITVRWPCCAGSSFALTSVTVDGKSDYYCYYDSGSRSHRSDNRQDRKTTDCFATFQNYYALRDYIITIKSDFESCSVTQTTLPAVPTFRDASLIAEDKIHLSWQDDNYCREMQKPIYKISWTSPDGVQHEEEKAQKELLITSLSPFTEYTLTLRACDNNKHKYDNKFCSGNITLTRTTKPGTPSEPFNLTAMTLNTSAILLTWEHPRQPRGLINGYNVTCRSGKRGVLSASVFGNKTTTYLVSFLQLWTQYTCAVRAFNIDASNTIYGGESTVRAFTKPAHPSEPIGFKVVHVTSDYISLSWQRPLTPRGPIDGYVLKLYNDLEEKDQVLPPSASEHHFNLLNPGTEYNVSIFAFNYDIDGRKRLYLNGTKVIVSDRTKAGAPSAPRDVRIVEITSKEIFLKWKRPSTPKGPIDGFVIRIVTDESEEVLSGPSLHKRLTNLSPDTNYTLAIFAFNMDGTKQLGGEEVILQTKTKHIEMSSSEILDHFREDMTFQMSLMNRLLNETIQTLKGNDRLPKPAR